MHLAGGKNGVVCVGTWEHHEGEVHSLSFSLCLPLSVSGLAAPGTTGGARCMPSHTQMMHVNLAGGCCRVPNANLI